jgi:hypothetical protein
MLFTIAIGYIGMMSERVDERRILFELVVCIMGLKPSPSGETFRSTS